MIITVDSMEIYIHKDHNALNKVEKCMLWLILDHSKLLGS